MQKSALLAVAVLALVGAVAWVLVGGGESTDAAAGVSSSEVVAPALPGAPATLSAAAGPVSEPVRGTLAPQPDSRRSAAKALDEAAEQTKPTGPLYRGRVLDPSGQGVPEALVRLKSQEAGRASGMLGVLGNIITPSKSAVTDSMGRYEIESPGGSTVDVEVEADGYAPFERSDIELPVTTSVPFEDLVLEPGTILWGTVTDDIGSPIAGAELQLVDPEQGFNFNFGPGGSVADTVTDENGGFELAQLEVGAWGIRIEAEGYPIRVYRGSTEAPGRVRSPLRFEIPRGGTIRGVAVGLPEVKVEDLRVVARPSEGATFMAMASGSAPQVELGEGGSFEIGGLDPDREYEVELVEKGRGAFAMMGGGANRSESVSVLPGAEGVELVYRQPASVSFAVVDAASGKPIERFTARLGMAFNQRRLEGADGEEKTFHAGGRDEFSDLFPSDFQFFGNRGDSGVRLSIEAEGYAAGREDVEGIEEGASIDVGTISLRAAPLIRVHVTDLNDGEPLRNARVRLTPQPTEDADSPNGWMERMDLANQVKKTKSDDDGWAEIQSIPDVPCTLEVDRAGYAPHQIADLVVGSSPVELEVALGEGGDVEVFVVDRRGERLAGVIVERRDADDEDDSSGTRNTSKRNGARFRNLTPGTHSFRVSNGDNSGRNNWRRARGGDDDEGWTMVSVSHGSSQELTLEARATSTMVGRVRQAGRTLASAKVRAQRLDEGDDVEEQLARMTGSRGWWGGDSADTNGSGEYRLEGLEVGTYTVSVSHDSRALAWTTTVEVTDGEVTANFDLPLCAVEGRVVDSEGRGIAGVRVRALPESRRFQSLDRDNGGFSRSGIDVVDVGVVGASGPRASDDRGLTDAQGHFRLEGLTAGARLVARADGDTVTSAVSAVFELAEDEVKTGIELVVEQAGTIVVQPQSGGEDSTGFSFVRVVARPKDGPQAQLAQPLALAGGDGPTDVAATEDSSAQVPVAPVSGFSIGGGDVRLSGLRPGTWLVKASEGGIEDGAEAEIEVEVRSGEVITVEIALP
ncbi:carboxypeptidase-like regulatory domain-containing protein [Engelhardtia mirabilis]|uniref:Alpha-2-macroglobulin MG1 domain protein n=1 Tax=Engelhardtia mirabilis TaxID=2528011 RepID=A0A518BMY5_9BACT|nr:Alpha-2-macroglobulin MG1 domain protein [Planctomycetes bacterium Pla133]QDV02643.1 Alpha-2-macroglobulin MG1 domain protein [Planctomycetes bacterium Pla86]